ncbi:hypothetical protein FRW55_01965 [Mycoplasma anserisalpingitidis]|uniref:Transglutaminase-like domain-containing protein n=1 Tax=Mycoplasma anserisalpingitidis TaxID=519450 RepID=A0A5B8K6Q9_9MOLU|nr:transglutaminase domain-containing protein [Mycoplasma anserisalpingitidis]QDY86914.1 hypothetical protein FRW55_01920 [Mycoplasma anserisalpingitidis]QDY86923.1 hypothetical protein FRW55_01965 [Mycoplasma anserisalpingitidis]
MRLFAHIKIKKNYRNFIDLLNLIDKTKFINDKKIDIEKFDDILLSINKNNKKININLFIQSIDFLILLNSLGYLEINLLKFKHLIDYSFTKLQKTINKNTQSDKLKKKINEFNFLVNSVLLFKEEKEYKEYCKIVDQTIKVFNNLLKSNINLSSKKISKKTKFILIIASSVLGFIAVSSALIIPTTLHILNKDKTKENKTVPWTELQPSIKVKYNLYKLKNIPWSFHNRINDNITNKTEEKLNILDEQFAKNSDLNIKWVQISNYYDESSLDLRGDYKRKLENLFNSKKDIDTLISQIIDLNKEYKNNIEKYYEDIFLYFNKYTKPTHNLLNKSLLVNKVYEETSNIIVDSIIKEFNYEFVNNYDIYQKNSFEHLKSFYSDINKFIDLINKHSLFVKDLKLRYLPTEDDTNEIKKIFNDFRNEQNSNFDIYIIKTIQNYIDYFSKGNFFPLIVERLTYFKNNFDFAIKEHTMQWFITKDKKYTLNPGNAENIEWRLPYMRDSIYGLIVLNSEYIISWLKNYDEWLWVINNDEKIGKINLENVNAFNHYKDFKNEFIANEFKDYENFYINVIGWKRDFYEDEILKNLYEILIKIYGEDNFKINDWNSEINFSDNPYIPNNFDFDLYKKYLNNSIDSAEVSRPIIYDLLTEQPNYFSDFQQNSLWGLKLKNKFVYKEINIDKNYDFPGINKLTKTKYGSIDFDNYEDKETTRRQFIQWRKNWEKLLSKFISKNWNQKQIILALSFYINSNVMYMYNNTERSFNTDGNNFYNPASLFETDRTLQCYGYSQNLSLALTLLNIPVRIITGETFSDTQNPLVSSGGHAWNEVFIDNKWVSVDLTFADYYESWSNFNSELNLEEIFLDRDSGSRTMFRLDFLSYITTIIKYLNKDENGNYVHNYVDLPTHYSTNPETELKWENMLPLLRKQYKTNQY